MEQGRALDRWDAALAASVAVLALAVFWPVLTYGFIGYDDPQYVSANPQVQAGLSARNVAWAFTHVHHANWHPLTTLSHMADASLFGLNAKGHHATSLALHLLNATLLFLSLRVMTGRRELAAATAALFALHPLNVEAVAWISSRKDVLSTAFGLLAVLAYARYARQPNPARYGFVVVLFILSLLSKPMLVTLPLLLLLLDYWPLDRAREGTKRLVLEKVPMLAVSTAIAAVAVYTQQSGDALRTLDEMPLATRLANAVVSYAMYPIKTVCPTGLGVFYPFPHHVPLWKWTAALVFLAAVTVAAVVWARRRPYGLLGWGWYLVALLPVSGLVQVGGHARADRYAYVPMIGLLVALVWTLGNAQRRRAVHVVAACFAAALILLATAQVRHWRSDEALYRHTLAVTTDNARMHFNLANGLAAQGRTEEAERHYREAMRIDPGHWKTRVNLGILYGQAGRLDLAREMLEAALTIAPDAFDAHVNLANLCAIEGKREQAIAHLEAAHAANPDDVGVAQALQALAAPGPTGEDQ